MKNTPLHTIARGVAIFTGLVILFLAGAWVGCEYSQINWMMITLRVIAIAAIATIIWFAGRFSRGIPTTSEEEDE